MRVPPKSTPLMITDSRSRASGGSSSSAVLPASLLWLSSSAEFACSTADTAPKSSNRAWRRLTLRALWGAPYEQRVSRTSWILLTGKRLKSRMRLGGRVGTPRGILVKCLLMGRAVKSTMLCFAFCSACSIVWNEIRDWNTVENRGASVRISSWEGLFSLYVMLWIQHKMLLRHACGLPLFCCSLRVTWFYSHLYNIIGKCSRERKKNMVIWKKCISLKLLILHFLFRYTSLSTFLSAS